MENNSILYQEYVGYVVDEDDEVVVVQFYEKGKEQAGKSVMETSFYKSEFSSKVEWGDKVHATVSINKIQKGEGTTTPDKEEEFQQILKRVTEASREYYKNKEDMDGV